MKKLLFLIILLIPFTIKAVSINDIHYKWKYEDQKDVMGLYNTDNYFITHTEDKLVSLDKRTGEKKEVSVEIRSVHIMIDNNILLITPSEEYGPVSIILYDGQLNEISNIQTEEIFYNIVMPYKDEGVVIVGNKETNEGTFLVSILVDKNGKVTNTETQKVTSRTDPVRDEYNKENVFIDFNNNTFKIDGYKIKPINTNEDGSYMYLTNTKLYKLSSTGETIDSVDIPNGQGTRIVKYNNYYYLASGNYTTTGTETSIALDLYKIDEDLNIMETNTIEAPEEKTNHEVPDGGFNRKYHNIYVLRNTVRCSIYSWIDSHYYSSNYSVASDLEITKDVNYSSDKAYQNSYVWFTLNSNYLLYFVDPIKSYEGNHGLLIGDLPSDITDTEYQTINETLGYLDGVRYREVYRDGKNYVVIDAYERCEGNDCYSIRGSDYLFTSKAEMIYLDNNYNEVFRKNLVDWHTVMQGQTDDDILNKKTRTLVKPYDEYLVVAVSSTTGNLLQIYDREGNLLKDFSEEISEYENLMVYDLYINERGIYVSLTCREDDRFVPHFSGSSFIYNYGRLKYYIYDYDETHTHSVIVHLSSDFSINRKVTGNGTITTTLEKAEEGTIVKVTVTPDPGYVLGVIKVIDSKGNVLTFTNNTFTMPASDVIIEATFVPINPNTGDIAILAILLITLSSLVIFALEKRRLNTLK